LGETTPPRLAEAARYLTAAVALRPNSPGVHVNLGEALRKGGQIDEAILCFHQALTLDPKYTAAHYNLGLALVGQGEVDEAIASFRKAIALDPKSALAYTGLGNALETKREMDGAIANYRKAIAIDPKLADPHYSLGNALTAKGEVDGAIASYRKAIAIDPRHSRAHTNLGIALRAKGEVDEAIASFQIAIAIDPNLAQAHSNLGNALYNRGELKEAREAFVRALELYPTKHPHRAGATAQLQDCERLLKLEGRLPRILRGEDQAGSAPEGLDLALLCQLKGRHAAATRFLASAFAADPKLAVDLNAGNRYTGASSAALAGAGKGEDAAQTDEKERARLRRQALDWLRADLEVWGQTLEQQPDKARPRVAQTMQQWLRDADFNGVRAPEALARLPQAERESWHKLWADVAATLARAQDEPGPPQGKPAPPEGPKKDRAPR
jgi:Tfp pilus assembly protein PilF